MSFDFSKLLSVAWGGWTTTWPTQLLALIWLAWLASWVGASFWQGRTQKLIAQVRKNGYSAADIPAIALTAFAMLPNASLAGFALLIAGLGGSGFSIAQSTLAFHAARPEMRARILGLLSVSIGMGPIGFLQVGLLADAVGAQLAIVILGCEGLLALLLTHRFWREIRMGSE